MKNKLVRIIRSYPSSFRRLLTLKALPVAVLFACAVAVPASAQIGFLPGQLSGYNGSNPTSLQYGPDGRLYISTQGGYLHALTISREEAGVYEVVENEIITLVREIPNHNDNATPHPVVARQVTGILVTGTASSPVIYVTSSDYRIGGAGGATDTNLDTNSGILSRLTRHLPGGEWTKLDLVRGLPRSEENHASNGIQLDPLTNTLYIAQGGNTNAGAPSNNFAFLGETALAAAILSVDLDAIDAMPIQGTTSDHPWVYDLPTLDDPARTNLPDGSDPGDPFGGNDGLNQAKLVPGGPVQIHAPGFRNPYDLVITDSGRMYTVDNGANQGWGGTPLLNDPADPATATNDYISSEPGSVSPDANGNQVTNKDTLHFISGPGYYGGHPTPIRANPASAGWYTFGSSGAWRTSTDPSDPFPLPVNWPPVPLEMANPIEGEFQSANNPNALWEWPVSTNGITEYTASNFDSAMTGNLLTVTFNGKLERIVLNPAGDTALSVTTTASNFGVMPLDVTAQADDDPFPGTIWVACYGSNIIAVFEPTDYDGASGVPCTGEDDPFLDEDGDGYSNADEIANGTDPCNPSDTPPDFNGNFISDLLDPDDDSDGIADIHDPFQLDFDNGATEHLPISFELLNGDPGYGFAGVGFSGWMIDNQTDYPDLYNDDQLIVGGAAGIFTITDIGHGDAWLGQNDQKNAFQFGLNADAQTGPFYVVTRIMATALFQPTPQDYQSAGLYIGTGDQDNYLRISAAANGGQGGIEIFYESAGVEVFHQMLPAPEVLTASESIDLYLSINPATGAVLPSFAADEGPMQALSPVMIVEPILGLLRKAPDSNWSNTLAIGIMATSNPRELGTPLEDTQFTASWDFIYALHHDEPLLHQWQTLTTANTCEARHESGLAAIDGNVVLIGGRGIKPVEHLDLDTHTWMQGAPPPIQLHHFQPVAYEGLIYITGAFTGHYPAESPVDRIYIYDPVASTWHAGPIIPEERRRGSAGSALCNGKIYLAGGSTLGHGQGVETTVAWLDVYDPVTNTWTTLPDAPHPRDHTQLVEAGGKLYLVGGRIGGTPDNFFAATVPEIDVYDSVTNTWSSLPPGENLPTPRGGITAARLGPRVVVAGGESDQPAAHAEVEAYHIHEQTWETLPSLIQQRHGTGMVSVGEALYIVAGAGSRGGSPELNSVEIFSDGPDPVNPMEAVIPGTAGFSPASLSFDEVTAGTTASETIRFSNTGGNQGLVIHDITISGTDFSAEHPYTFPFVLAPNHEIDIEVIFNTSGSSGSKNATLTASYGSGNSLALPVEGTLIGGAPPDPVRINVGGPLYMDSLGQVWAADSHYVGGSPFNAGTIAIANTADPTLYRTERWGGNSFSYAIPMEPGRYDVNLLFAEIYLGVQTGVGQNHAGKRVFSVSLEDTEVLPDYDIWADAGPATAVTQSFQNIEVLDGVLNITVNVAADSAKFSAIEILPTPSGLISSPAELDFGTVTPDANSTLPITLTNTSDHLLNITSVALSGTDADAFSVSTLSDAELEPGASTVLDVTFTPEDTGAKNASMEITHSGENDALSIPLSGTAEPPAPPQAVRINAGGPQYTDSLDQVWAADSHFSGGSSHNAGSIDIENTTEPALYRTERWGGNSFSYAIPVEPGVYDVHLHFAEIYLGVQTGVGQNHAGKRVFSVSLEGNEVLPGYDIWADAGPATAVTRSFPNIAVTDGMLNITVDTSVNNAKFSAIEIVPAVGGLGSDPGSLNFGTVEISNDSTLPLTLTNYGDEPLTISSADPDGTDAASFSFPSFTPIELAPGESTTLDVTFAPADGGAKSAELTLTHSGPNSPKTISLSGIGQAPSPPAAVRINAGGPEYLDSQGLLWSADSHFAGGSPHNAGAIDIANTNDPALYRTERWGSNSLNYAIPVASGSYDVRLHFAEIYLGVQSGVGQNHAGKRVFSVSLEGTEVLPDYDIWADAGPATAVIQSFPNIAVIDGVLNITVNTSVNNAKFSAIEIVPAVGGLASSPGSLHFGTVDIGNDSTLHFTLTNTGEGPLTISGGALNGPDVAAFSFPSLSATELAPGQSIVVELTFTPTDGGAKSATLEITHTGPNSPISIPLSGIGQAPAPPGTVRINAGGPQYMDTLGQVWSADSYFTGGGSYNAGSIDIEDTDNEVLFRTERWGNNSFSYQIPLVNSSYNVHLYFAEIFWGVQSGVGQNHTGKRVFSVSLEGTEVLTNYDIWSTAGPATAAKQSFYNIEVLDGFLNITVNNQADNAKFAAIEIIPIP